MPTLPLALIVALLSPEAGPIDVSAERLEAGPDGWRAEGLRLALPAADVRAETGEGRRTEACADGRFRLTDVRLDGRRIRGEAAEARLCVSGDAAQIEADALWISPCGCADPPWRLSASSASVTPGEGAWLSWPVLRAGTVPVLAAPAVYLPLARRRTGFLVPRLGWDGADGLYGSLPFFWAAGRSWDLTAAPGWRAGLGFTADGRLRWAANPDDEGGIELWSAPVAGEAVVVGSGALPVGPVRLAVDGQWADSGASWRRRRPGFIERGRRHLHADVGAAATGGDLGIGLRLHRLQQLAPEAVEATVPLAWMHVGADLGPTRLILDGAALQVWRAGPDGEVFDLGLRAEAREWLGPIELRPVLAGRTRIHPATDVGPAEQSLAGLAGIEATVAIRRRYAAELHRIALTADGRWAAASQPGARVLDHADRPIDARDVGLTLSTALAGAAWSGRASARIGWSALNDAPAPIWLRGRLDGPWIGLGLDGAADGQLAARALWLDGRFGPADGLHASLGGLWARVGAELPWLTPVGLTLPTRQVPAIHAADDALEPGAWVADGSIAGLTAGLTLPLGPLTAGWTGGFDLTPAAPALLVGQIGTLDWRGRCDCWSAGLWIGHEAGRAAPDVMLSLTLGRL